MTISYGRRLVLLPDIATLAGLALVTTLFLTQLMALSGRITLTQERIAQNLAEEKRAILADLMRMPIPPVCYDCRPPVFEIPTFRLVLPARYPDIARHNKIKGYAEVRLTVLADGSVDDPIITEEMPEGYGFGSAALTAIRGWKFYQGFRTANATISFRINYEIPPDPFKIGLPGIGLPGKITPIYKK